MSSSSPIRVFIFVLLLGLLLVGQAVEVRGQSPANRAALVVSYAEGISEAVCVSFSEEEISGYDLLRRSGLDMISEASGLGEAICRIGGEADTRGCNFPPQKCFCECQGADCLYWSYWRLENGEWRYSQQGSSLSRVGNGSVEGWVWGSGTLNQDADRSPPLVAFEDVCKDPTATPTQTATLPAATSTATATHTPKPDEPDDTATPIPTATHTPTTGPTPTVTATPFVPPTIRLFAVDRSPISYGESATLSWDVVDSTQVMLRYPGGEEVVPAQSSRSVSPEKSTEYSLVASSPVGQAEAVLSVEVNPLISAPTPDPASAGAEVAAVASTASWTPSWTPTSVPGETPAPTNTVAPVNTPMSSDMLMVTETPMPGNTPITSVPPDMETDDMPEPAAVAQATSPPVITLVVTPEPVSLSQGDDQTETSAPPPVVVLDPVDGQTADARLTSDVSGAERTYLLVGLSVLIGVPILFGGIWLIVWLTWKRE
jgi:hypothetical protein